MTLQTIDVAIGMVFVYLLLTLVASTIVELISAACNWRGEMLFAGIRTLLADSPISAGELYDTPFIRTLSRPASAFSSRLDVLDRVGWLLPADDTRAPRTPPSYIPQAAFSNAVLHLLWRQCREGLPPDQPEVTARSVGAYLDRGTRSDTDMLAAVVSTALATQGASIQAVRLAIERAFNDSMERVSGWYKRRTQTCLLVLGITGALAGNVDSIHIVQWLWNSNAARQAVVSAAIDISKSSSAPKAAEPANGTTVTAALKQLATDMNGAAQQFEVLQLPVGWPQSISWFWFVQYLLGCLLSGIAVSVGSSFWFDALQSLIKIRATGPRPASR